MWDYESQEPFSGKIRDVSKIAPEKSKSSQVKPKMSVNYVVKIIRLNNVLMKESLVWEWDTTSSDTKEKLPDGKSKSVDCSKPYWGQPVIWRPAQSVNGITNLVRYHHTRGTLTPENLLELDPRKDQLGTGCKLILPDSKTKVWG